jgi:putative oligomerization/nucleic acid binding protein
MLIASSYPFLGVFETIIVIALWVIWFWILITVFSDLFRRSDIGGGAKVLWFIFVIILPYLGVFIYLIVNHNGMMERNERAVRQQQQHMDDYVRSVAGSGSDPAEQIAKAKQLLDSGAITQAEFDTIKAKALG